MIRQLSRNVSTYIDLIVALLLGAAFLAVCLWWTWSDLRGAFANDNVTASLMDGQVFGPVLIGRLAWFAAALAVTHLSFGLLALGFACLTVAAAPQFAADRRLALIPLWFLVLVAVALMANATWYPASRFSPADSWLQLSWHGVKPVHAVLTALTLLVIGLASRVFLRLRSGRPRVAMLVSACVVLLLIGTLLS
ncbi:MAG TPA: hypothetical protein VMQ83_06075, partial [Gammaproteobacteria bacterium]|nr:hypothetical protein [Gammaproteobacteria bacterium]